MDRQCKARRDDGLPCRATPTRSGFCFWHDPELAAEAAEARRLGGIRRRREGAVAGAYDYEGLDTVEKIRRVFDIAAIDALGMDTSVAKVRALIAVGLAAVKLLEVGEYEERLRALEAALGPRLAGKRR